MSRRRRTCQQLTAQLIVIVGFCATACGARTPAPADTAIAAYVVRVHRDTTPAQLAGLRALGLQGDVHNSFGVNGLVYRMTAAQRTQVAAMPFVVSVAVLEPADKVDASWLAAAADPVQVTIDLFEHIDPGRRQQIVRTLIAGGALIQSAHRATLQARVPKRLVADILQLPEVVWIEPATPNPAHAPVSSPKP